MNHQPSVPDSPVPTGPGQFTNGTHNTERTSDPDEWFDSTKLWDALASLKRLRDERLKLLNEQLRDVVEQQFDGEFSFEDIEREPENQKMISDMTQKMYEKYITPIEDRITALKGFLS